jgi:hypothetical protein
MAAEVETAVIPNNMMSKNPAHLSNILITSPPKQMVVHEGP